MKRVALCVPDPQNYLDLRDRYSLVLINPKTDVLLRDSMIAQAQCSALIDSTGFHSLQDGPDYAQEAMVFATSGSSGMPKFCSFTQHQLDLKIAQLCEWFDISANDRYVSFMPLWHVLGMTSYLSARRAQCQVSFLDFKDIRHLANHHPTFLIGSASVLRLLQQLPLPVLRFVRATTEPLTVDLYDAFRQTFKTVIIENHGMTEALGACLSNPLYGEQRPGTVGLPLGIEARIRNDQLEIKGPTVCVDGWYGTGDLAECDEQGYYRILGRIKDIITINSNKIRPAVVERMLLERHPEIGEVVVFGKHSVNVLYDGDCNTNDLMTDIRSLCLGYRPALVQRVDSIPRADSGKVSRSMLAAQMCVD